MSNVNITGSYPVVRSRLIKEENLQPVRESPAIAPLKKKGAVISTQPTKWSTSAGHSLYKQVQDLSSMDDRAGDSDNNEDSIGRSIDTYA